MVELGQGKTDRHQIAYDTLLSSAAMTVAHELTHYFVGMLATKCGADTPIQVTVGDFAPSQDHGESGWTFMYYLSAVSQRMSGTRTTRSIIARAANYGWKTLE